MKNKKIKIEENEKIQDPVREVTELFFRIFFYISLVFITIFMCWYGYFICTHTFYAVKGASMMPTLNNSIPYNQMEGARDISYDAVYVQDKNPKLFDIIVIERPGKDSIIKRLIATEGDYVTIAKVEDQDGNESFKLFRIPANTDLESLSDKSALLQESGENGYTIYEPNTLWVHQNYNSTYVQMTTNVGQNFFVNYYEYNFYMTFLKDYHSGSNYNYFVSDKGLLYVQVPEGKFFYLGDNREHSTDAREEGFCDFEKISGKVDYIVQNNNFFTRIFSLIKIYFGKIEKFFAR